MERAVFVAGLRRFLAVFGIAVAAVAVFSVVVGIIVGARLTRSIALGYYLSGAALLIGGFFVGNRGPVRANRNQPIPIFGTRFVRWATPEELDEAINTSAVYVSLGFALILVGVLADTV
ncbi:MAG: hypothetical protein E6F94_06325 [Actinobacteria bacterium]|nr:MAG: hypothetical protein E6G38_05165 [Actinomycetota bacterium]TMM26301.1 MAG: hypothetical protein E6F94_06325 [Actinomycetota bacterium]